MTVTGTKPCPDCFGPNTATICPTCLGREVVPDAPAVCGHHGIRLVKVDTVWACYRCFSELFQPTTFTIPDTCWRLCLEDHEGRTELWDVERSQMVTDIAIPGYVVKVLALLGPPAVGGKKVTYARSARTNPRLPGALDWHARNIEQWVSPDDPADTHPIPETWPS